MTGPDPNLAVQTIGPLSTGLLLGAVGLVLTLLLLENKKLPAALVLIVSRHCSGGAAREASGSGSVCLGLPCAQAGALRMAWLGAISYG